MTEGREIFPDCMAPDGAEPCQGYQQLLMKYQNVVAINDHLSGEIVKKIKALTEENERLFAENKSLKERQSA